MYDDTYELLSSKENTVTNTLRYSKLSRDDAAAKFTCQASNTKQTPPVATDTHVTLNRKLYLFFYFPGFTFLSWRGPYLLPNLLFLDNAILIL